MKGAPDNPKQCDATSIATHYTGFVWLKRISSYVPMQIIIKMSPHLLLKYHSYTNEFLKEEKQLNHSIPPSLLGRSLGFYSRYYP